VRKKCFFGKVGCAGWQSSTKNTSAFAQILAYFYNSPVFCPGWVLTEPSDTGNQYEYKNQVNSFLGGSPTSKLTSLWQLKLHRLWPFFNDHGLIFRNVNFFLIPNRPTALLPETTYYWAVKPKKRCGEKASLIHPFSFTTPKFFCMVKICS